MSAKANEFKIGIFVVSALGIGFVAVVALGAGQVFRQKILFETYLNESVQGLEVGAPVKYRGVQVGNVESIGFAEEGYTTMNRYVMVTVNFFPPKTGRVRRENFDDRLQVLIAEGT
jgi:phospholipid/cholesterol/gamma-HCH transport system substrate-binding protein